MPVKSLGGESNQIKKELRERERKKGGWTQRAQREREERRRVSLLP